MRFAVDLFFQNGGTAAYILRTNADAGPAPFASTPRLLTRDLTFSEPGPAATFSDVLRAASPGEWGRTSTRSFNIAR